MKLNYLFISKTKIGEKEIACWEVTATCKYFN